MDQRKLTWAYAAIGVASVLVLGLGLWLSAGSPPRQADPPVTPGDRSLGGATGPAADLFGGRLSLGDEPDQSVDPGQTGGEPVLVEAVRPGGETAPPPGSVPGPHRDHQAPVPEIGVAVAPAPVCAAEIEALQAVIDGQSREIAEMGRAMASLAELLKTQAKADPGGGSMDEAQPERSDRSTAGNGPETQASAESAEEVESVAGSGQDSPAGGEWHTVRSGDILSALSQRAGVRWGCVAEWSGIDDPNRLEVGDRVLLVPEDGIPARCRYDASTVSRPATPRSSEGGGMDVGGWRLVMISGHGEVAGIRRGEAFMLVEPGMEVPGLGRIERIDIRGRRLVTTRGIVGYSG